MAKMRDVGKGGIAQDIFIPKEQKHAEGRLARPSMRINVSMDSMIGPGGGSEFDRQELKRCKQECVAMRDEIDNWDPEDVARRAFKSLKSNLAVKEARMEEIRARLGEYDDDDEPDEPPKKKLQAKKDAKRDMKGHGMADDENDDETDDEDSQEEDEED